jgi:hypothetical protein
MESIIFGEMAEEALRCVTPLLGTLQSVQLPATPGRSKGPRDVLFPKS